MHKQHIVCFCDDEEHCKKQTEEIANKNNATIWFVEPVYAPLSHQIIYKGTIVSEYMFGATLQALRQISLLHIK